MSPTKLTDRIMDILANTFDLKTGLEPEEFIALTKDIHDACEEEMTFRPGAIIPRPDDSKVAQVHGSVICYPNQRDFDKLVEKLAEAKPGQFLPLDPDEMLMLLDLKVWP